MGSQDILRQTLDEKYLNVGKHYTRLGDQLVDGKGSIGRKQNRKVMGENIEKPTREMGMLHPVAALFPT